MTAEEALKLSPTGFIWSDYGSPAYRDDGGTYRWTNSCPVNVSFLEQTHAWYPLPPSLREKAFTVTDEQGTKTFYCCREQHRLEKRIAELEAENAELRKQKPKLRLKSCKDEPPKVGFACVVLSQHYYLDLTDYEIELPEVE